MNEDERQLLLTIGIGLYNVLARMAKSCSEDDPDGEILIAAAMGIQTSVQKLDPNGDIVRKVSAMVDDAFAQQDADEGHDEQKPN